MAIRIEHGVPIVEANRFSNFYRDPGELAEWADYFSRTGIPSAIALTDEGYALYRTGMESMPDEVD